MLKAVWGLTHFLDVGPTVLMRRAVDKPFLMGIESVDLLRRSGLIQKLLSWKNLQTDPPDLVFASDALPPTKPLEGAF